MPETNLTPAQRIVKHETNIAKNIEQIQRNNGAIAQQENNYRALLKEQRDLDATSPTFWQKVTLDDSLEKAKNAKNTQVQDQLDQTTQLKSDTFALKEDTYKEQGLLKEAHLDQQEQHNTHIDALEKSRDASAQRLDRLESYEPTQEHEKAEQTKKIKNERKELKKRDQKLAAAKQESQQAQQAAQQREDKVANKIKETCPNKCLATEIFVKSNNAKRRFELKAQSQQPITPLQVISASQATVNKKMREPAVSIIEVGVTGTCEKGKPSTAPGSSQLKELVRLSNQQHCPLISTRQGPTNLSMPGNASQPLKFQAFCPDPPDNFTSWVYFFQNVFMTDQRKPAIYNLEAQGCEGSYPLAAQIEAYPKVKFELGVSIGYKPLNEVDLLAKKKEDKKEIKSDYKKGQRTVEYGSWVFEFNLKGSADHVNLAFKLEHLDPDTLLPKLRKAINAFIFIFDIVRICCNNQSGSNIFAQSVDKLGNLIDDNAKIDSDLANSLKKPEADQKKSTVGELARIDTGFSPTGSITINYPKLSLGLAYENCEAMGKPTLGDAVALQLKLDPLIGIKAKVDILSALIKIGANALLPGSAAAGRAFVKYMWPILKDLLPDDTAVTEQNIKDRNYYLEGGVALVLTVGANVTAEGKWTHSNDAENLTVSHVNLPPDPANNPEVGAFSGMAGASLEMHLEGKAYVKGKAWAVNFEAGFIIAVGAAKEIGAAKLEYKLNITEKNDQIMVDGVFEWNGLALIRASYKTFSIGSKDNARDNDRRKSGLRGGAKRRESETKPEFSTKDLKNQWVLIEPGKTPKDTDPVPLYDYFNA